MGRREKVHGLYVLVPLRDYHLAYILAGLKLLREKHKASGNKAQVTYINRLYNHLKTYFSELIKATKVYRRYLDHNPLVNDPPIDARPIKDIEIYLDPEYPGVSDV